MPSVVHDTPRYANNRAEVSHQPTRRRERHMRRFKSAAQAQRFLAVHDVARNLFSVGRISCVPPSNGCCVRGPSTRGTPWPHPEAMASDIALVCRHPR